MGWKCENRGMCVVRKKEKQKLEKRENKYKYFFGNTFDIKSTNCFLYHLVLIFHLLMPLILEHNGSA